MVTSMWEDGKDFCSEGNSLPLSEDSNFHFFGRRKTGGLQHSLS